MYHEVNLAVCMYTYSLSKHLKFTKMFTNINIKFLIK